MKSLRTLFHGSGAGNLDALLGIVFLALGVIIGASFAPSVITQLVTASTTTGATAAAVSMTQIGQLVGVLALTVGPALAGLYIIFKNVKGSG